MDDFERFLREDFKLCRRCGEMKPLSFFRKSRTWDDGRAKTCKECGINGRGRRERRAEELRREREEKERELCVEAIARAELARHGLDICQGCKLAKPYKEFPLPGKTRGRGHIRKCLDCRPTYPVSLLNLKYAGSDTTHRKLNTALARGAKRAWDAGVPTEALSAEQVLSYWKDTLRIAPDLCTYCEKQSYEHLDHAIPIKRKGTPGHVLHNLLPSCAKCNVLKRTLTAHEFRQAMHTVSNIAYNAELVAQAAEYKAQAEHYKTLSDDLMERLLGSREWVA